jgi:hypothetical protein
LVVDVPGEGVRSEALDPVAAVVKNTRVVAGELASSAV